MASRLTSKPSFEERLDRYVERGLKSARGGSPGEKSTRNKVFAPAATAASPAKVNLRHAQAYSPGQLSPARAPGDAGLASNHHLSVSFSRIAFELGDQQPSSASRSSSPRPTEQHHSPLRSALKKSASPPSSPVPSAASPAKEAGSRPASSSSSSSPSSSQRAATRAENLKQLAMIAEIMRVKSLRGGAGTHNAGREAGYDFEEGEFDLDDYDRGKFPASFGLDRERAAKTRTTVVTNQTRRLAEGQKRVWEGTKETKATAASSKSSSAATSPVSPSSSPGSPWRWSPAVSGEGWAYPDATAATTTAEAKKQKRPIFTRGTVHASWDGASIASAAFPVATATTTAMALPAATRPASAKRPAAHAGQATRRYSICTASAGSSVYEDNSLLLMIGVKPSQEQEEDEDEDKGERAEEQR